MLIQEVENRTGLDRATIRFYEKEGIITPKRNHENGYRSYSEDDIQLLLKIKLLRQLDVSLVTIKEMMQRKRQLDVVLTDQITFLENRIQSDSRSISVCEQMCNDKVDFDSIESNRYLRMLTDPQQKKEVYQEQVEREVHPLRRFFARKIDQMLVITILDFVAIVILKIRPASTALFTVLQILGYFLAVPIEAAMLHLLGTTVGKWTMGIRIEDINGGKPEFDDALSRSFCVLKEGCGFYIPIWSLYKMYKNYNTASVAINNLWDENTEIVYKSWRIPRKSVIAIVLCLIIVLDCVSFRNSVMPRNRGVNLTISEFAENYSDYMKIFGFEDSKYILSKAGTWERNDAENVIIIGQGSDTTRESFQFEMDGEHITAIHFRDEWENIEFIDIIPAYCLIATFAFVGSREDVKYEDIRELEKSLDAISKELQRKSGTYLNNEVFTGNVQIQEVTISWTMEIKGDVIFANGMLLTPTSSDTQSLYRLEYCIELQ